MTQLSDPAGGAIWKLWHANDALLVEYLFIRFVDDRGRQYSSKDVATWVNARPHLGLQMDETTIEKLRSGATKRLSRETILALVDFFGITPEYFAPEIAPNPEALDRVYLTAVEGLVRALAPAGVPEQVFNGLLTFTGGVARIHLATRELADLRRPGGPPATVPEPTEPEPVTPDGWMRSSSLVEYLFNTHRKPDGTRYSAREVAEGVTVWAEGKRRRISFSQSGLLKLREGTTEQPSQDMMAGLAAFFRVPPGYFFPPLVPDAGPRAELLSTTLIQVTVALEPVRLPPHMLAKIQRAVRDAVGPHLNYMAAVAAARALKEGPTRSPSGPADQMQL